jgi:hypothetical protein
MRFHLYLLLLISFCIFSCSDNKVEHQLQFHSPDYELSDFKSVNINSTFKVQENQVSIKSIFISENTQQLILTSSEDSSFFHLYDLQTLASKGNFIQIPKEVKSSFFRMRLLNAENTLQVLDDYNQRLLLYDVTRLNHDHYQPAAIDLPFSYNDPVIIDSIFTLADDVKRKKADHLYLVSLLKPPYEIAEAMPVNKLFLNDTDLIDTIAYNTTHQGIFHKSKNTNEWLYIYEKIPLLQIFDSTMILQKTAIGPDSIFFQDIRVKDKSNSYSYFQPYTDRPSYFSLEAKFNSDYIFVGLKDKYDDLFISKILQFNHRLQPQYVYHLEQKASVFDIDFLNKKIYYADDKKSNRLYSFDFHSN